MSDPFADDRSDPTHYPADKAIEVALFGKIVIDQSLEGLDMIQPHDFYFGRNGELWSRTRATWDSGAPLDPLLITDGDLELFSILLEGQATAEPLTRAIDYARKLRDLAQKRRLIPVSQQLLEMSHNGASPELIADYLQHEIDKLRQGMTTGNMFDRWKTQGITAAEAAKLGMVERVYLVEDLIREKSVSIFYGAPGEFKSALCMDLALCIGNGIPWLQPLPVEGNKQRAYATQCTRVLWLNYDQGYDDIIERLGAMARVYGDGANVTAISQSYPTATLTSENQALALGAYCAREGYRVLIVDSLLDVKGKSDLQEAGMGDVLRLWRIVAESGNACVIIIAHNTKTSLDLYGSQFIKAKLDHLYYVSRPPGTDVAIIESKKQRNFGEQSKLYARWTWSHFDDTRTLKTARFFGDSTEAKLVHPNNTTQAAIRSILMASPGRGFNVNKLADILNADREEDDKVTVGAIRKAANRLVDNDRSIGKAEPDNEENLYHYGELTDGHSTIYR